MKLLLLFLLFSSSILAQSEFLDGFQSNISYHKKNVLQFADEWHSNDIVPELESGGISIENTKDGISITISPDVKLGGISGTFHGYEGFKYNDSIDFYCKIGDKYCKIVYRKGMHIKITTFKNCRKTITYFYLKKNT